MRFDLGVTADGHAAIEIPRSEDSPEDFARVAGPLESLLGLKVLAGSSDRSAEGTATRVYAEGFELQERPGSFLLICPTALRQYETAIRLKTELRWQPRSRVYAWAAVTDEVEELIDVLYRTMALLVHASHDYEREAPDIVDEAVGHLKGVIAAIRNGDDWTVENVHNIYFNVAGAKPDSVPEPWNQRFLKLAGEVGAALTAYSQSLKAQ